MIKTNNKSKLCIILVVERVKNDVIISASETLTVSPEYACVSNINCLGTMDYIAGISNCNCVRTTSCTTRFARCTTDVFELIAISIGIVQVLYVTYAYNLAGKVVRRRVKSYATSVCFLIVIDAVTGMR